MSLSPIRLQQGTIILCTLVVALFLGSRSSMEWLVLLIMALAGLMILQSLVLGLFAIVVAALVIPLEFQTGTTVTLNLVTLAVPALSLLWLLTQLRRQTFSLVPSNTHRPLFAFLLAGLLAFLVGRALWDPQIPQAPNFWLVQLAQWAIFVFSALAYWLTAHLIQNERQLQMMTLVFLLIAGGIAILQFSPFFTPILARFTTFSFIRAPLWVLLAGLAGGQLFFNQQLYFPTRLLCFGILIAVGFYAFWQQRDSASNWMGVGMTLAVLVWLRYPHLRWVWLIGLIGISYWSYPFRLIYEFAGGEEEWIGSGESRLVLMERVIEETMRNPITGLGPAAYRPYTRVKPLHYGYAFWVDPQISAHNNYVDLFAHVGLIGLGLFLWFIWELGRLGVRLHQKYQKGFSAAYINGMLAVGVGMLGIMFLADWGLPFVYNIGFPGFQASVLIWLFMGGLVVLDQSGKTANGK